MMVFISHSSKDKWIARRLSQDLEARDITTFLDEKDIQTGDSIDDSIQEHLAESDEVLMLLSPTALDSHWVLLEIGGARALGKRLVPVLLHVGANELPAPLAKGLARDLNDIERYYEEIERRAAGEEVITPTELEVEGSGAATRRRRGQRRQRNSYKVGDRVKIPEEPQPDFTTNAGLTVGWEEGMTRYAGRVGTVVTVDDDRTVNLDVDDEEWWWAMDWLEPVSER
jgi:TIR domain/Mind bomb SH3 repeat domain